MSTITVVRCDYCRDTFRTVAEADAHEMRCASKPTGAAPDDICSYCHEREDVRRTSFVHGDLEPSTFYIHRRDGWHFPDYGIGQHVFRKPLAVVAAPVEDATNG